MTLAELAPRETALEAGGYVKGVAVALVTQNRDPEGLCRVKVSYPWHQQPRDSYWARLAMPMAGKDRGWVLIPEVGDEVLVAFNSVKGTVLLALADGKKVELDDDGIRVDDGAGNKVAIDSRGGALSIEAATRLTIKAPLVTIESSGPMEVKASATLTLRGTLVNIN
jgi:phage baseplate assembly protein gpV